MAIVAVVVLAGAGCGKPDSTAPGTPSEPPAAQPSASGCSHPYYPLSEGYSIAYQTDLAEATGITFVMAVVESGADSARVEYRFSEPSNVVMAQELECVGGQINTKGYMNMAEGLGQDGGMEFETVNVEGALMPTNVGVGSEWTTAYDTVMNMGDIPLPPGMPSQVNARVSQRNVVLAEEDITVAAGTFRALKFEVRMITEMDMPGLPVPPEPVEILSSQWWAKGVGMVRSESQDGMVVEAVEVVLP
ncbi:hypothetical protein ACFL26_00785 [Patescibacteria group bacterium]